MKKAGIIGGLSPESTILYYRMIIQLYQERVKDGNYPEIVINSINLKRLNDIIENGDLESLTLYLLEAIGAIARAGADFAIIASNTPHIIFNRLRVQSPIHLISIVEETCKKVKHLGIGRVGLLGTKVTMQGDFYPEVFLKNDVSLVVPEKGEQNYIHTKIVSELVNGEILEETESNFLKIVERMKLGDRVEGIILGCTELPLILQEGRFGLTFLNTAAIHAESAVNYMLEEK